MIQGYLVSEGTLDWHLQSTKSRKTLCSPCWPPLLLSYFLVFPAFQSQESLIRADDRIIKTAAVLRRRENAPGLGIAKCTIDRIPPGLITSKRNVCDNEAQLLVVCYSLHKLYRCIAASDQWSAEIMRKCAVL